MELTPDFSKVMACFDPSQQANEVQSIGPYEIDDQKYEALSTLCNKFKVQDHSQDLGYFFRKLLHPIAATKLVNLLLREFGQAAEGFKLKSFLDRTNTRIGGQPFDVFAESKRGNHPLKIIYKQIEIEIDDDQTVHTILDYLTGLQESLLKRSRGLEIEAVDRSLESNRVPSNILRDHIALLVFTYLNNNELLKKNKADRYFFIYQLLALGEHTFNIDLNNADDEISRRKSLIDSVRRCIENERKRQFRRFTTDPS